MTTIFHAAFLAAERELGATIGYPALVYDAGGHAATCQCAGCSIEQRDEEIRRLHGTIRELRAELARRNDDVHALRQQLDEARQIIGGLEAAYNHEHAAADRYEATRGTADWDVAGIDLEEAEIATARHFSAARAWLRRGA